MITPLCKLGYKYGTDKCPQIRHHYTPFYFELLKDKRETVKKVLEIGIGHYKGMRINEWHYDRGLNIQYHRGASLYMWRDFFPNASVFGADILPETIFEDERIKTYLCDEQKKEDLIKLIENIGSDIDLLIDDASHRTQDQTFTAQTLLPLLNKKVIYIIEDVTHSKLIRQDLGKSGDFEFDVPSIPGLPPRNGKQQHGSMILVIKNKHNGTE